MWRTAEGRRPRLDGIGKSLGFRAFRRMDKGCGKAGWVKLGYRLSSRDSPAGWLIAQGLTADFPLKSGKNLIKSVIIGKQGEKS